MLPRKRTAWATSHQQPTVLPRAGYYLPRPRAFGISRASTLLHLLFTYSTYMHAVPPLPSSSEPPSHAWAVSSFRTHPHRRQLLLILYCTDRFLILVPVSLSMFDSQSVHSRVSARSLEGILSMQPLSRHRQIRHISSSKPLIPPRHFETFSGYQAFDTFHTWPEMPNPF
ncbi:hypothetical protein ONS95_005968 [Cadophora gregata]|uniref:uncharacterized protein n=1 Tax=Cadophora gregata TaxID=51156 RepID=UPI0026DBF08E|nr:uncharacterized protein ONS95_005968 [Cadophora gregata]KAK0102345.1 hypothetical protein ONS95_005968 [Cadophora gregata]